MFAHVKIFFGFFLQTFLLAMINDGTVPLEELFLFIEQPVVCAGIRDLRVLKTTQSAFREFFTDEFRTLPDANDRILSTIVTANWWYNTSEGFCFDKAW
jgi:hypothetical protein